MRKSCGLIFCFITIFSTSFAELSIVDPPFLNSFNPPSHEPCLVINNRPLGKINGKVISLYDVIKKMNLFLFEYYPDYKPSSVERYQFYMNRWETTLDDMINNELILLDAAQKEIKVSDGQCFPRCFHCIYPNGCWSLFV